MHICSIQCNLSTLILYPDKSTGLSPQPLKHCQCEVYQMDYNHVKHLHLEIIKTSEDGIEVYQPTWRIANIIHNIVMTGSVFGGFGVFGQWGRFWLLCYPGLSHLITAGGLLGNQALLCSKICQSIKLF